MTKHHKKVHALVLLLYIALIVGSAFMSPKYTFAAWNNTKTWTTKEDFTGGATVDGVRVSGDNDAEDANNNDNLSLNSETVSNQTVAAGYSNTFVIKNNGSLWGAGYNVDGALGLGDTLNRSSMVEIVPSDVKSVSSYAVHMLYLKNDGTVWGAGYNANGGLGIGNFTTTSNITQAKINSSTYLTNIVKVETGYYHSLAVDAAGKLYVTGYNSYGQLGRGNTTTVAYWEAAAALPGYSSTNEYDVIDIAAAERDSMILIKEKATGDKYVFGTGGNTYGELGIDVIGQQNTWIKSNISNAVDVSMATYQSYAIVESELINRAVYSVGLGSDGRLALGDTTNRSSWSETSLTGVSTIYAGASNVFAINADGLVYAAGNNTYNQLNVGDSSSKSTWNLSNYRDVAYLVSSISNTVVVLNYSGELTGAGFNIYDQFGTGNQRFYNTPTKINFANTNVASGYYTTYSLKNNVLWSTGHNGEYRAGISEGFYRTQFTQTPISGVQKVVGGESHTLLLKTDGTVWGVGADNYGQLGTGSTTTSRVNPTQGKINSSTYLTGVVDIAAGRIHSIALDSSGNVYTTGFNGTGQLGNGNTTSMSYWTLVATGAKKIGANYGSSYYVKNDGTNTLMGVGQNIYGELGLGNYDSPKTTWQTSTTDVLEIYVGPYNIFIKKADGFYGVGYNGRGALGIGSYTTKNTWTLIPALTSDVVDISVGYYHSLALFSTGKVMSTGHNYYGQLGLGDFDNRNTWTEVMSSGAVAISTGHDNSIIIKNDGYLYGLGWDGYGQLGMGLSPFIISPTQINNNIKQPSAFLSEGKIDNLIFDAGETVKWENLLFQAEVPAGTTLRFRVRGAANEAGLANATWSNYISNTGADPNIDSSRWLELEIDLTSSDGLKTPILESVSMIYYTDVTAPSNPNSIQAWTNSGKTTALADNTWANSGSVYFEWSGAADEDQGSGVKGYWVYFGEDNTADPYTAGEFQTGSSKTFELSSQDDGKAIYLCIATEDYAGNVYTNSESPYYSLFTYKFDATRPQAPSSTTVSPIGWSLENNFDISWNPATDPGANNSGIVNYEYKRAGGGDSWATIPYSNDTITIPDVVSYQDGDNQFYIRSLDNAGNYSGGDDPENPTSGVTVVHYYYNGLAPSKPLSLTVEPQSSIQNDFTFIWDAPANVNGSIKGYYYSVNELPDLSNTVFTAQTTTGSIPAATKQGFNDFYVVAIDNSDNVSWANYETIKFECNTTAPGIPASLVVSDSSSMATSDWALTTKWQAPGIGVVDHYNVYRSTDGNNFSKVAETASTGYLDSGLSNTSTYYYKISAVDNANSESAFSSIISKQPTGKFTEPPIVVTGPEVDAKATNATVIWSTNRESSSFVAYGKSRDNLESKGQLDNETSHSVIVSGLEPGSTYYYKVQSFDENRDYPTSESFSDIYSFTTQSAPGIEDVSVEEVSLNSAIITWKTTSSATSKVVYGKGTSFDNYVQDKSGSMVTIHTVRLVELNHSTTYNFRIEGTDVDGNKLSSDNYSFTTLVFPRISNVRFEQQKNSVTSTLKVTWESNVPLTTTVTYKNDGTAVKEASSSKLSTNHEILVTNLKDNTEYLMTVKGRDAFGNEAISDTNRVKTDFDTRPPKIINVTTETDIVGYGVDAKGQLVVSWETDESATSQVEYGLGTTGSYTNTTQEDISHTTSHVVIISDLKPSTPYHFRIVSRDVSDNKALGDEYSVLTPQVTKSVFDAILTALDNAIGWLFRN